MPLPLVADLDQFATWFTSAGVVLVFFLLGLSISGSQLNHGYKPVSLHLFVGLWNFVGFPAISFFLLWLFGDHLATEFHVGFLILAVIPTTIASAVAFTDLSGGDVPVAIFSTILSNVLAVFAVPMLATLILSLATEVSINWTTLFLKITLLILVPLILGQFVQRISLRFRAFFEPKRKVASSAVILMIVYFAFADRLQGGEWGAVSGIDVLGLCLAVLVLLLLVSLMVWFTLKLLPVARSQKIAAFYCASQKSLATGLPLAVIILANGDFGNEALVLLPLIVFHPVQLLLSGVLVEPFKRHDQMA